MKNRSQSIARLFSGHVSLLFLTQQTSFLLLPAFISSLKDRGTAYFESSLRFVLMRFGKLAGLVSRASNAVWHVDSHRWVTPWSAGPQQYSAKCTISVFPVRKKFHLLSMETRYHRSRWETTGKAI